MKLKLEVLTKYIFVVVSILCLTFLRPLLILIYPFLFLVFIILFRCKFTVNVLVFLTISVFVGLISMLVEGNFFVNYLLSFYLIFSPLILLNLKSKELIFTISQGLFEMFFKIFSSVLTVVNVSAMIYAVVVISTSDYPDDVFTGLYGTSGFGSHTLSIINLIVSVYYFYLKKYKGFVFFFVCGILGFYGLGLMLFLLTIAVINIPYIIKKIKLIFIGSLVSVVLVSVIYTLNPGNFDYIILNIKDSTRVFTSYKYNEEMEKVQNYERTFVPRYFTFIDGANSLFFSNLKVFLIGTSPGTFNSRTAFYLNGDFVRSAFIKEHFSENTTYHEAYVKPLLNWKLLTSQRWNDGTRNQPFSSIVSILLEYGAFIGGLILFIFFKRIKSIRKHTTSIQKSNYIKFLVVYLFFLMLLQNYMEYPEIIVYFILVFKLIDIDNINEINNSKINAR